MIYFIDIDDTICYRKDELGGKFDYNKSVPYKERIAKINELYKSGHRIVYWTARGSGSGTDWSDLTKKQLKNWGVLYHELRFGKPVYDVFIDDKAFNADDWDWNKNGH